MRIQMILAGIGGQGILFASKILTELGLKLGLDVMGSETHGMSQRGGSVIAHLKLGDFQSPMIRTGTADILLAFDGSEAYKSLKFVKKNGLCILNLKSIALFDKAVLNYLRKNEITVLAYDASGKAQEIGSVRSANIILLGFSLGTGQLPFKAGDVRGIIGSLSKEKDRDLNLKAFEMGLWAGEQEKIDF